MQKSIRVTLLGREYTLRVREENESLTRELANYVDGKLKAFRSAHPEQSDTTAAIITAMAIAEELFLERTDRDESHDALSDDIDAISRQLASAVSTD